MIWLQFIATSAVIVFAATRLATYGDIIAVRTRLGRMFVGVVLLAGATSTPEVLTIFSSIKQGVPNLAAGNLMGSNMFNMVLLAVLDLASQNQRILRDSALKHSLSGSLTTLLIALVVLFIIADIDLTIGWVGIDSLVLIGVYVFAIYLIQRESNVQPDVEYYIPANYPTLRHGLLGFLIATLALVLVTPLLVEASAGIAEITGLGTTFIGTTLLAIVTSMPELVTSIAAIRLGANDMAIGNLFGSNMFNMFALGLTDLFYLPGRFFAIIDPTFALVGILGLIMTVMALIGNQARIERRFFIIEIDALALFIVYIGGLYLLYTQGVTP